MEILRELAGRRRSAPATSLRAATSRQPTVSHHLKVLREAGARESERRGNWVYYRIAPDRRSQRARGGHRRRALVPGEPAPRLHADGMGGSGRTASRGRLAVDVSRTYSADRAFQTGGQTASAGQQPGAASQRSGGPATRPDRASGDRVDADERTLLQRQRLCADQPGTRSLKSGSWPTSTGRAGSPTSNRIASRPRRRGRRRAARRSSPPRRAISSNDAGRVARTHLGRCDDRAGPEPSSARNRRAGGTASRPCSRAAGRVVRSRSRLGIAGVGVA